jgi:hypothetical protein
MKTENEIYTEVVVGLFIAQRKIAELGEPIAVQDTILTPVRFADGQFGIVSSGDRCPDVLVSAKATVSAAIARSTCMPVLTDVPGQAWILVAGCDTGGQYVAQLHFGQPQGSLSDQLARAKL